MIDKKTPHPYAHIIEIFMRKGIEEKNFQNLYTYYVRCFEELYQDEYINWTQVDYEETGDSAHKSALFVTEIFIEVFLSEKAKGHGDQWSLAVANCGEEGDLVYHVAYNEIVKTNPELAKKEILIRSKSLSNDEVFIKHHIYIYETEIHDTDRINRATKYSEIYKDQIAKGKSVVYAHEYALLLSRGKYNTIYCEEYAYAYDKAIKEGKSEAYALEFAEVYGDELVDIKSRYGISEDEDQINYAIEKVDVYMTAWEYNEKHELKNFKRFADIYETIYFKTYYPNELGLEGIKEEIDMEILEKALKQYNNMMAKKHPDFNK
jgi:hypothetical protein